MVKNDSVEYISCFNDYISITFFTHLNGGSTKVGGGVGRGRKGEGEGKWEDGEVESSNDREKFLHSLCN